MHLSRWSTISLIAFALTACTDSLDPKTVPGAYGLTDINGRQLPTYEAPTPGATRTINGAGLSIDFGDAASLIQDITRFDGTELTVTTNYTYRLKDHDLIFALSSPCAADANCVSPPKGKITSTGDIDLEMGNGGISILYHFHHITLAY
jgi:hypothetical protein